MKFYRADLNDCAQAPGIVVVIDVLRAFTTAAFAFGQGARDILLVGSVEDALALKTAHPGALTLGEVDGVPVSGFDFSNSPAEISRSVLRGMRLVHRSSTGTQGVVRSQNAQVILAASFAVAGATARRVRSLLHGPDAASPVSFVVTGAVVSGAGDEDAACADYIEALLKNENPDPAPYLERVRRSPHGQLFGDPLHPEFPLADLELATSLDAFDFAMQVRREDGLLVLERAA